MYRALKHIIGFCLTQFFSEIRVRGAQKLEQGPLLVVVNHPNMALDSLLIAKIFERDLWFIAKSTLFKNPWLNWLFEKCHMVPVHRRQDAEGSEVNNQETFGRVVAALCASQAVAIFPEGVSLGVRKLAQLKTGAARMAFQAEESRNFDLGLKIQAVGITYSNLHDFKSRVTLTFAEPLAVSRFRQAYEADAQKAARALTEGIEEKLREVTVEVANEEHTELVEKITNIYRSTAEDLDDNELMNLIARNIEEIGPAGFEASADLREKIEIFSELAELFAVDSGFSFSNPRSNIWMWLFSPFFLLAYLINVFPYRLVGRLAARGAKEPVTSASIKFGAGILVFGAWYLLISLLAGLKWGVSGFFLLLFLCIASGYLLNRYLNYLTVFILSNFWPVKKQPLELLRLMRDDLISELNSSRVK